MRIPSTCASTTEPYRDMRLNSSRVTSRVALKAYAGQVCNVSRGPESSPCHRRECAELRLQRSTGATGRIALNYFEIKLFFDFIFAIAAWRLR